MSTISPPSRHAVGTRLGARLPGGPTSAWLGLALVVLAAAILAIACHAHHPEAVPRVALITAGVLVLFGLCGDAISLRLVPAHWRSVRPFLALVFGAVVSGMVLMAFGYCHVPSTSACGSPWPSAFPLHGGCGVTHPGATIVIPKIASSPCV